MKKILVMSLLMVFGTIILSSCDRKIKDNNISGLGCPEISAEEETIVSQDGKIAARDVVEGYSPLSKKQTSGKRGNVIIWCALLVSLFANAGFTIVCFVRMDGRSKNRCRRLRDKFDELNDKFNWEKHQSSKPTIVKQELTDAEIYLIVDRVRECMQLDLKEKEEEQKKEMMEKHVDKPKVETSVPQEPKIMKKMYATAANENDDFFARVTEQHDDDTVYILSLTDDNNASFVVHDNVMEDYLRRACDIIGTGNNIESCEPGLAQKTSDGTWKIIKKANVKFV